MTLVSTVEAHALPDVDDPGRVPGSGAIRVRGRRQGFDEAVHLFLNPSSASAEPCFLHIVCCSANSRLNLCSNHCDCTKDRFFVRLLVVQTPSFEGTALLRDDIMPFEGIWFRQILEQGAQSAVVHVL